MKTKYIILFLLVSVKSFAQDPIFILPNAQSELLNPATTGLNPKVSIQYQNQDRPEEQVFLGADFNYKKQRLGIYLYNDNQGYGRLIKQSVMANYAKDFQISEHTQLHIGASAQLLKNTATMISSSIPSLTRYLPNFSIGGILTHKNVYIGLASHNIFEPNESFYHSTGPGTNLPRRWTVNIGGRIKLNNKLSIIPSIIYQKQQQFEMLLPALQINCGPVMLGASKFFTPNVTNINVANIYLGYINNRIKISYAYGWTNPQIISSNTHCISLNYFFKQKNKGNNFSELMRSLL